MTATDGTGATGSADIAWQVGGHITISSQDGPQPVGGGGIGTTVNLPFAVSDNAANDILTYDSSQLPRGLHLDTADSLITGWQMDQTRSATVTVNGLDGGTASKTLSFDPAPAVAGATGPVRLDTGGKCMDDRGDGSADGTIVQDWDCNGGAAQQWTYYSDGTFRINGKCLTVEPTTTSYSREDLATCDPGGDPSQEWVAGTAGQLRSLQPSPPYGFCLADGAAGTVNGDQLYASACNNAPGDPQGEWTLPALTVFSAIAGRCLDDSQAADVNGAVVDAATCSAKATQHWTFEPDGTIRVNGECLDDRGNGSTIGTKIQLWSCTSGDASQQWTVTGSDDSLGLSLRHGSLCATPTSFTAANGAQLFLDSCGGDKTYWHAW